MKDMTQGNPVKEVLLFSVPMILASVFQQMYNAVDSIIVGQFVGANALAAVGAAFPAMFLATSVLIGITMGVQIIISQLFGAGEHERMRATFATSIISLMILVVIASVIGYFASGTILELMNTPPEIIADSKAYLDEIFKGLIFMFLYNLYTSVLRGVGDSKTPLYFLIISSILNIVLDLVYVIQFGMASGALPLPLCSPRRYRSYCALSTPISAFRCSAWASRISEWTLESCARSSGLESPLRSSRASAPLAPCWCRAWSTLSAPPRRRPLRPAIRWNPL